jgi:hypothetical protein
MGTPHETLTARPLAVLAAAAVLVLAGCGEPRRYGDADGTPTAFTVNLDRAFINGFENRQARPSVGAGVGFSSGGGSYSGVGVGLTFSTTQVYLLGGESVGQGEVFRQELKWGENHFSVPLTPGRTLHLTVMAEGGRRGWEGIGSLVVPQAAEPAATIVLGAEGGKVTTTPAPAPAPAKP